MRKILSIIILTFCFHTSKAEEIIIYLGEAYHYNEFLGGMSDAQFAIKYDTENKIYYFYSSDIFNTHVKSFLEGISSEEIQKKIEEHKKQNEVEDLFK